jgi:hypothetical protein
MVLLEEDLYGSVLFDVVTPSGIVVFVVESRDRARCNRGQAVLAGTSLGRWGFEPLSHMVGQLSPETERFAGQRSAQMQGAPPSNGPRKATRAACMHCNLRFCVPGGFVLFCFRICEQQRPPGVCQVFPDAEPAWWGRRRLFLNLQAQVQTRRTSRAPWRQGNSMT